MGTSRAAKGGLFSDAIYVAVEGVAKLIRDKAAFKAHWTVDTPGIVLIKVKATRINSLTTGMGKKKVR